jgi:hypothetical protein
MASVGSSTVAMIRVFSMVSPRWRASLISRTRTAPDCLRNRLLVAPRPVRDLLLCAKDLFVAAMGAILPAEGEFEQAAKEAERSTVFHR